MKLFSRHGLRQWVAGVCENAERIARHRSAVGVIFVLELTGCTIFPLPVALILVAFVTAAPQKWVRFALGATAGSLIGGIALYVVGLAFFSSLGQPLMVYYGSEARWAEVVNWFNGEWGLVFVMLAGVTTGLFRVASLAAGFTAMNPLLFLGLMLVSRSVRFLAECGAIRYVGDRARIRSAGYLKYATAGAVVLLVATIVIVTLSP
jgi:membrane protein YqaA with SNARE-associated domain